MDLVSPRCSLRLLFLVSAHGGLSQAAQVALTDLGHDVTVAVVASPESMVSAVRDHKPDLIVCPMLTKMIPEEVWSQHLCLVLHPGPEGDRGPSAIDWAIELGCPEGGVTVLEANGEFDAGTVWASRTFTRRSVTKSSLYRHEVRYAGIDALVEAVTRVAAGAGAPASATRSATGQERPLMRQDVRTIDWRADSTDVVLRKIRAGDGQPGVLDSIGGTQFHLFGAHPEATLRGNPGEILAQRHGAVCRATVDGAVWISHLKQRNTQERTYIKLPAVTALVRACVPVDVPELPVRIDLRFDEPTADTFREIVYHEANGVGYLYFDFYNGAMSTEQCRRLREAYRYAQSCRTTRVIALMGGRDFFSTGIHLNVIEVAADPALESWRNLHAINDVVRDVVTTNTHYVVAALRGDVAAGGVAFALAADRVVARDGIVLNPYYQHMGGLYGSEYWTYLLPRRLGSPMAAELTTAPFTPISTRRALQIGMLDATFGPTAEEFQGGVVAEAEHIAAADGLADWLELKRRRRARDERRKPLEHYRREELARSHECFFGPNRHYHQARSRFTHKRPLISFAERFVVQT
ncbi:MAG TPA: enoyl-CoA hydratase-related protein [Jatrophihabitantaceae bacterium]|nr:enoyl-CoA hydratase-related protein [Jatrophihabitantaceae bacterium]